MQSMVVAAAGIVSDPKLGQPMSQLWIASAPAHPTLVGKLTLKVTKQMA